MCASVLALFLVIGSVSAAANFTLDQTSYTFDDEGVFELTITNNNFGGDETPVLEALTVSISDWTLENNFPSELILSSDAEATIELGILEDDKSATITVTLALTDDNDISNALDFLETVEGTFTVTAGEEVETITITIENTNFNDEENDGDLDVSIDNDFTVRGVGDDDEWFLFDEVEVDVTIDNKGDYDIEDIEIEVCLFDVEEDECILDEGDMEISEDKFDLDKNDEMDITLTFNLDADDYSEDSNKLILYVKAVGELTGDDAEDDEVDGDKTGAEDSENANVIIEKNYVMINEVSMLETIEHMF